MRRWIPIIILLALGIFGWSTAVSLADVAISDSVTVTVTISEGESSLEIDEEDVPFGNRAGSVDNHRFVAGPLTVNFFPATSSWYIKIYTDNGLPGNIGGLRGVTDDTQLLPLKCWTANYGPHPDEEGNYSPRDLDFNVPDPEHDPYWIDWWYWVFDKNARDKGKPVVRKLIDPAAEILDTFKVYLAIETAGIEPQKYGATEEHPEYGQVTIKFVVE